MDTINYFKIKSLVEVCITNKLREIFKDRYKVELGGQNWKNNEAHGNFVLKNYPGGVDADEVSEDDKAFVQRGIISNYTFKILHKLLTQFQFQKVNKQLLESQTQIINHINHLYLINVIDNKQFTIDDKKYVQVKNELVQLLKELHHTSSATSDNDTNNHNINNSTNHNIDQQIAYILDTLQDNNNDGNNSNQYTINKENEANAIKIKESGNAHYGQLKYYTALESYDNALKLSDISSYTKSILLLNSCTASTEINRIESREKCTRSLVKGGYIPVKNARSFGIDAIANRPSWSKAYCKLGQVFSLISRYQVSIELFKASLILDNSSANINLIQPLINHAQTRLDIMNQCLKPNGKRDYEKETEMTLHQVLDFKRLILDNYKKKLDQKYLRNLFRILPKYYDGLVAIGIPERIAIDLNVELTVGPYFDAKEKGEPEVLKKEQSQDAFDRLIGNGTELASIWHKAKQNIYDKPVLNENDKKSILALIMKITSLPFPLAVAKKPVNKEKYFINYDVLVACEFLGTVYNCGGYGEDIDYEKAEYYFKRVIEGQLKIKKEYLKERKSIGFGYIALADIYISNALNELKFNISEYNCLVLGKNVKLAVQIWKLGRNLPGDQFSQICTECYDGSSVHDPNREASAMEQGGKIPTIDLKSDPKNNLVLLGLECDFRRDEELRSLFPIDLVEVKKEISGGSEFSKVVYQVFSDTATFIESFQKYIKQQQSSTSTNNSSIKERIQLIEPLAKLYCKKSLHYYIRIPPSLAEQLTEFINKLYQEAMDDKVVTVCYLGINRFDDYLVLHKAANRLAPGPDNDGFFADEYDETLAYFSCIFSLNAISMKEVLNKCIMYDQEYNSSSYYFNYLALLILFYVGYQPSIKESTYLELFGRAFEFTDELANDHHDLQCYYSLLTHAINSTNIKIPDKQEMIFDLFGCMTHTRTSMLNYLKYEDRTMHRYICNSISSVARSFLQTHHFNN